MAREYVRIHQRMWGDGVILLHPQRTAEWTAEWRAHPAGWHVYTIYEAGRIDVPLYVGCTGQLATRLATHRMRRAWWPLVGDILVERFDDLYEALEAEHQRIRRMGPLFNIADNRHRPEFDPSTYVPLEVPAHG